jgi:hypothetical protein
MRLHWHGSAKPRELLRDRRVRFLCNDGGRIAAGFKGDAGNCVTRAIAIATGKPYAKSTTTLQAAIDRYAATHRDRACMKSGFWDDGFLHRLAERR